MRSFMLFFKWNLVQKRGLKHYNPRPKMARVRYVFEYWLIKENVCKSTYKESGTIKFPTLLNLLKHLKYFKSLHALRVWDSDPFKNNKEWHILCLFIQFSTYVYNTFLLFQPQFCKWSYLEICKPYTFMGGPGIPKLYYH